jgi:hypothetical protein
MMIRILFSRTFILFSLFLLSSVIYAQFENKNASSLKADAQKSFESGNYSVALGQYRNLLILYPKDGVFSYYCGVSLLNLNKDIPKAIEYLEFSSYNAAVPYKVFYYLGDSYTRNYKFPEAKNAYDHFAKVATKSEDKELAPERLSEMSANAVELTKSYNQVDVQASSLFTFADTAYTGRLRELGGTLSFKPASFSPTPEGLNDLSNFMFIPRNSSKGDFVFYAGYGKSRKHGKDIFMVKTLNGHKYTEPVAVDAINTDYDELLPYYDPIGKDLIFASRGHNSMGGFDLFKSHYDSERNIWTPPVNLGFPVNSPSDEYLMIPGTDMGNIMLITNRQGHDTMMTAYMIRIHEPRVKVNIPDQVELKKIGTFGGIEAIPDMVDMITGNILSDTITASLPGSYAAGSAMPIPAAENMEISADYSKLLRLALDQQYIADSLAKLAREARLDVRVKTDPNERWNMQKNIISWERGSSDSQAKADEYYLKIKQMENKKNETKRIPDAIMIDTVINDITVYRYKQADTIQGDSETKQKDIVNAEVSIKTPSTGDAGNISGGQKPFLKDMNQFEVLNKSPYSANNPFPEDVDIPKGVYYKIQLVVKSKEPGWDVFGGLSPITAEPVLNKPMKKYYAGKFTVYENSIKALEEVHRNGFPEAFIASWFDGQKMTLSKVVEMEKK